MTQEPTGQINLLLVDFCVVCMHEYSVFSVNKVTTLGTPEILV